MLVRFGHFYAFVLLLACLAINIAFFDKVREPFLGDVDPTASVKSAFSDLDIQAKIAEFYPQTQSNADESAIKEAAEEASPPEAEKPVRIEELPVPPPAPAPPANDPPLVPVIAEPVIESLLPSEPEEPTPTVSAVPEIRESPRQMVAAVPTPTPATLQPVVAAQFKPIVTEKKSSMPVKPSSSPVWDTGDSGRARPIRYD